MTLQELSDDEIKEKLETLLLSEDLEELSNSTSYFNIFNALKLQNNEIRHSNFLGWLMTPYETHGIGNYFLKEFLKQAIKNYSSLKDYTKFDLNDIACLSLSNVSIVRESEHNIDILIKSESDNFICVIENKIWTDVHDSDLDDGEKGSQLLKYAKYVEKEYPKYKKLYIYLAPYVDENADLIEVKHDIWYIPMNYEQVLKVIKKVLKFKSKLMPNEVRIFIEHYATMLERNIMRNISNDNFDLCKRIYQEHQYAIDLIVEQIEEEKEKRISDIIRQKVLAKLNLIYKETSVNTHIRCITKNIDIPELQFADNYGGMTGKNETQVLMFEFIRTKDSLTFAVGIGPIIQKDKVKKEILYKCLKKELHSVSCKQLTCGTNFISKQTIYNTAEFLDKIMNNSDDDIIVDITNKIDESGIIPKIERAVEDFKSKLIDENS